MSEPRATVIILVWNGREYLEACLDSVLAQGYEDLAVIVVDNGSTDGSPDLVAGKYPQVKLIRNDRNLGFAAGNNAGLKFVEATPGEVRGDFVVLLNQDTVVHPGWLAALASAFSDASVGITGCKLLYPDGTIQHAGGRVVGPRGETEHLDRHAQNEVGSAPKAEKPLALNDVEFVTGAALAIRQALLAEIGLLDEGFWPAYYEDIDLCFRARAARYRVVYQPQAVVTHHESTTTGALSRGRKQALNQGRLRFVFKHWDLAKLENEFGPAELAWVASMDRCEELMAARRAYLACLLGLPGILAFRRSSVNEADALVNLLTDLRAAAQSSLVSGGNQVTSGASELNRDSGSTSLLNRLAEGQTLREQPFTSQVPVAGRLIVAIRSLWNSVATKWYVRPMAQQQSLFNAQVVSYLRTVEQRLQGQSLDIAENLEEITRLAETLARASEKDYEGNSGD